MMNLQDELRQWAVWLEGRTPMFLKGTMARRAADALDAAEQRIREFEAMLREHYEGPQPFDGDWSRVALEWYGRRQAAAEAGGSDVS